MSFSDLQKQLNAASAKDAFHYEVGEDSLLPPKYYITTGVRTLDVTLGGNPEAGYGLPTGRMSSWFGPESVGKSTLMAQFIRYFQALGGHAMLIESEESTTSDRLRELGADPKRLTTVEPEEAAEVITLERGYSAMNHFLKVTSVPPFLDLPKIIIWDTISAAPSNAEHEKGMNAGGMAEAPRIHSTSLKSLISKLANTNTHFAVCQQVRDNIGSYMGGSGPTGGWALRHYPSIRVKLRKIATIPGDKAVSAIQVKAYTQKNKLTRPFRESIIHLYNHFGCDNDRSLLSTLIEKKVFRQAGGWYYIDGFSDSPIPFQVAKFIDKLDAVEGLREHLFNMVPDYV